MIAALRQILEQTIQRLSSLATGYVPALLAGATIFLSAVLLATCVRWLLARLFKGAGADRFLEQSGLASVVSPSRRLRATALAASGAYWTILGLGALTALSAFDTQLTSQMIEGAVLLFPKLITAAGILLIGAWLAQYLGRGALVWACNEGLPFPRRVAAAVRLITVFVAVVVAADHLNFAREVFLAAFVLVVGGAVLATSIALGMAAHGVIARRLTEGSAQPEAAADQTVWNHL